MKTSKIIIILLLILFIIGAAYFIYTPQNKDVELEIPVDVPSKEAPIEESVKLPEKNVLAKKEIDFSIEASHSSELNGIEILQKDFYIKNPSTGSMWDVSVFEPLGLGKNLPAVILVPGGTNDKSKFLSNASPIVEYSTAEKFASEGFITLIFSPEGRGDSEGVEDFNGYINQDGLYELYKFLKDHPNTDENNMGIISYSYGVAMASGMLGRYEVPLKYYIEWEGPVDKYYVTVGCVDRAPAKEGVGAVKAGITCDDDDYWAEREAIKFVPDFKVEYFIIVQKEKDHVQPTHKHSLEVNNLAVEHLDWVRVNGSENEINQIYNYDTFPLLTKRVDLSEVIISYINEII